MKKVFQYVGSIDYRRYFLEFPILLKIVFSTKLDRPMQQWRWQCYIQIVYALFKFFQLEVRITKFEYTATLEPSKLYRTLSFYLRGYGMQQNLKL